ncbi:hypothetical protein [Psychrobacillus psychrodurans]|uniref:Uncharacterized protein n=1 Tax=Psychrobacillus psychrodurans TaxID=126157 RepID=A0A9X3L627_9BACI|nr:hypothetical protein [Psychrobacillus psychrodurans]MCZ8532025.1 hypothetical protein [Psychrobacillus psychrodurans]
MMLVYDAPDLIIIVGGVMNQIHLLTTIKQNILRNSIIKSIIQHLQT